MHTLSTKRRVAGFKLVELLVVIAVLAVAISMLLPNLARSPHSHGIKCVNNLKNVGLAFRIFATDNQDRFPMEVSTNEGGSLEFVKDGAAAFRHFLVMSNELSTPALLVCPNDARRKSVTNFPALNQASLSYFVGLSARTGLTNAFLSGDRNLTTNGRPVRPGLVDLTAITIVGWTTEIHNLQGNVAMGDGSVQQFNGSRLAAALRGTGLATNRLVVP